MSVSSLIFAVLQAPEGKLKWKFDRGGRDSALKNEGNDFERSNINK
jgi:hypothetical protein